MILFPVSEEKKKWLQERMGALGVLEKDIEEKFVRSSGSGGQKVNKTSSCVYLKHLPTGIEVKCMRERNQSLNRFLARRELVLQVERLSGQRSVKDDRIIKVKRQKKKKGKEGPIEAWRIKEENLMKVLNIFSPSSDLFTDEIFENLLKTDRFVLKRIISSGQATPPGEWYDQDEEEWVIVLSGSAGLLFERGKKLYTMHPGDYIHIPAHKRHRVEWTDAKQKTIWLALHYH